VCLPRDFEPRNRPRFWQRQNSVKQLSNLTHFSPLPDNVSEPPTGMEEVFSSTKVYDALMSSPFAKFCVKDTGKTGLAYNLKVIVRFLMSLI
jgi:hypothetical protein